MLHALDLSLDLTLRHFYDTNTNTYTDNNDNNTNDSNNNDNFFLLSLLFLKNEFYLSIKNGKDIIVKRQCRENK